MKKTVGPAFKEVVDRKEGEGRIATWWKASQGNEFCKATVDEYAAALDQFMKGMGARITGQKS